MLELLFFITITLLLVRHRYFWTARKRPKPPKVMAHRGMKIKSPENTLSSYKEAISVGFKAIELDILQTQDGTLVCSHNFDLERETNGHGCIHHQNIAKVKEIQTGIYSHKANPQSIPTFFDVLATVPEDIFLNIEIKTHRLFDLSAAFTLGKSIRENGIKHPFMVSSFNPFVVAYYRLFHPNVSTGFILQDMEWSWVTHWIHPDYFHPRGDLVDGEMIEMSERHQLPLNLWTVNTLPAMAWCKRNKIASIITDNPQAVHG